MAHRGFLIANEGGYHALYSRKQGSKYNVEPKLNQAPFRVHHFKWTSNVLEKLKLRESEFKMQGIRWWVQSHKIRSYINKHGNKLNVDSPELGCKIMGIGKSVPSLPPIRWSPLKIPKQDTFTVILMSHSKARHRTQQLILNQMVNHGDYCHYFIDYLSPSGQHSDGAWSDLHMEFSEWRNAWNSTRNLGSYSSNTPTYFP